MSPSVSVVTIGNAIVDVLAQADDAFIQKHGLNKGAMTLIEAERAEHLYRLMGPAVEVSGGCAANTAAGIASLGGRAAFIGKVADDQLGQVFRHDIGAAGVAFPTLPLIGGAPTARSFILVTPDAQRTMNTYLGACVELGPDDVVPEVIAGAEATYLEGYLWDKPAAKDAFLKAAALAHAAGRKVSLTLSDSFCVERHRDSFLDLVHGHVDVLFGNADEIMALYRTATLEEGVAAVRGRCGLVAITRGAEGSLVLRGEETHAVPAEPVERLVDTTGAGDLYAAGFLHGLTTGRSPAECGWLGSLAAAEIISHIGARPMTSLAKLAEARGGPPPR